MKRTNLLRLTAILFMVAALASVFVTEGLAQTEEPPEGAEGRPPEEVSLFGETAYEGGHLLYSYQVGREGQEEYSITTTEIIPQDDGTYLVENSSSDVVSLAGVNIGFFGISLHGLGFRIPTSSGGTVDLSPLEALEDEVLEPNSEYVLPDGGYLVAGDAGTIAGIDVVYATYTHADFTNVQIHLAMPTDLTIRNLLPLFPYLELVYESDQLPEEGAEQDYQRMRSFSKIELIDFIYEP